MHLHQAPRSSRRPRTCSPDPTDTPRPGPRFEELLIVYGPVVRKIAGGFQRRLPCNVLRDDLIAAGMSGLWDAIQKHGAQDTPNFDWYVRVRVRGAILDELRAQDWLPRRARAAVNRAQKEQQGPSGGVPAVVRLEDVSDGEQARCLADNNGAENAEQEVARKMERRNLERLVSLLPERERHIVQMHYFHGMKFKELGRVLGVSEPRISQLHSRAMGRLRGLMSEDADAAA